MLMVFVWMLWKSGVRGAGWVLLSLAVCAVLYALAAALFPANRTGRGARTAISAYFFAAAVWDLASVCFCFFHGSYVNRGMGGAAVLLLSELLLLLAALLFAAFRNRRRKRAADKI